MPDVAAEPSKANVYLHIYDVSGEGVLAQVNEVFRGIGTGAFHAGVEVLGQEWSYGQAQRGESGIIVCKPRRNLCHRFRESLHMGQTPLSDEQVRDLLDKMHGEWLGADYDLLSRNCCHFSDDFCRRLGVGSAPDWLTNLAGAGAVVRSGVREAVTTAHISAGLAAEAAVEFDRHYQISNAVDEFSTREVEVDEKYIRNKAMDLWNHASQRLGHIEDLAEKIINDAQKPVSLDVGRVENAALGLWEWAVSATQALPGRGAVPMVTTTAPAHAPEQVESHTATVEPVAPACHKGLAAAAEPRAEKAAAAAAAAAAQDSPSSPAESAIKQVGFAISALDFDDAPTARGCLRKALKLLDSELVTADSPLSLDLPHRTLIKAQRLAQSAAAALSCQDSATAMHDAHQA
eukprot:CAMPEP_0172671312 /NCGR_PEP_ID=MMETSP1074-20121228/10836_1 /TAXON_ID=2916 /ORGANISM="Ceratium fusus, Strain PA161109" /LENGTH=403 /DNA_ID=CAMNT_0013488337 /DNA_START=30 /DNA_END=1238 /DNA_ORIENTATION=+